MQAGTVMSNWLNTITKYYQSAVKHNTDVSSEELKTDEALLLKHFQWIFGLWQRSDGAVQEQYERSPFRDSTQ